MNGESLPAEVPSTIDSPVAPPVPVDGSLRYNHMGNVNHPDSGPISAAATAAATRLAPVASELRARVPASRAALDAAGRVVTRAARDTDAALHRELQNPETKRLRDTGREFFSALAAVAVLYFARALSIAEQKLHLSSPSAGTAEPRSLLSRTRNVAIASIVTLQRNLFQKVRGRSTSADPVVTTDRPMSSTRGGEDSTVSRLVDIFREVAVQTNLVVGESALRMSQYRGEYHEYITPVACRVASFCGATHVSPQGSDDPVGETVGTLPFYPESSENNCNGLDVTKED